MTGGASWQYAAMNAAGWPADTSAQEGTTWVARSNDIVTFRAGAFFLRYSGSERVHLRTSLPSKAVGQATWFDVALLHRPAGSRYAWRKVSVSQQGEQTLAATGIDTFGAEVFVDYGHQGISYATGSGWGWLSFAQAGIVNGPPELLVVGVPIDPPEHPTDGGRWTLMARCGEARCEATETSAANDVAWGEAWPGEPWLGISVKTLEPQVRDLLGVQGGVRVEQVVPGGPAEAAGLRALDIVSSVDAQSFDTRSLRTIAFAAGVGGALQLAVFRQEMTPRIVTVVVGAAPDRRQEPAR